LAENELTVQNEKMQHAALVKVKTYKPKFANSASKFFENKVEKFQGDTTDLSSFSPYLSERVVV